jgi:hypothetical protein
MHLLGFTDLFQLVFLGLVREFRQVTRINGGLMRELLVIFVGQQNAALGVSCQKLLVLIELGLQELDALGFVSEDGLVSFFL